MRTHWIKTTMIALLLCSPAAGQVRQERAMAAGNARRARLEARWHPGLSTQLTPAQQGHIIGLYHPRLRPIVADSYRRADELEALLLEREIEAYRAEQEYYRSRPQTQIIVVPFGGYYYGTP